MTGPERSTDPSPLVNQADRFRRARGALKSLLALALTGYVLSCRPEAAASPEEMLARFQTPLLSSLRLSSWESTRRYLLVRNTLESFGVAPCLPQGRILNTPEDSSSEKISDHLESVDRPCYIEALQWWDRRSKVLYTPSEAMRRKNLHALKELAVTTRGGEPPCYYLFTNEETGYMNQFIEAIFSIQTSKTLPSVLYLLEGEASNHPGVKASPCHGSAK